MLATRLWGMATGSKSRRDGTEGSSGQFERRINMTCSQCGSDVAAGSAACPNCGAQQPGTGAQGAHTPAPPMAGGAPAAGASGQAFNFDAKRWTRDDQIVGGASLLLLISLFLPWYTASFGGQSASASGTSGHGYLWLVFILALVVVVYVILKAGFETLPFNLPIGPGQLLLGLTGINLILVLIAFLLKPGTGDGFVAISVGWGFGAFVGLICAIVAVVPLALPFVRARNAGR
jgi:hypothetical protein